MVAVRNKLILYLIVPIAGILAFMHFLPTSGNGHSEHYITFTTTWDTDKEEIIVSIMWALGPHVEGPTDIAVTQKHKIWSKTVPYKLGTPATVLIKAPRAKSVMCSIKVDDHVVVTPIEKHVFAECTIN